MKAPARPVAGGKIHFAAYSGLRQKRETPFGHDRASLKAQEKSGAKPFAPLGATPADYGAAAWRGHAGQKTMLAGPSDLAWLICSFHKTSSLPEYNKKPGKPGNNIAGFT